MSIRPLSIPSYIKIHQRTSIDFLDQVEEIRQGILQLNGDKPEVTVIIPAYNEEQSILRCLSSLSKSITDQKVEIIVVDNNSGDRTAEFIKLSGANYLLQTTQGVKHARNAGLASARGNFIINADADSVYSPYWIDLLTKPLRNEDVACTYGKFAFLPELKSNRLFYFIYETMADLYKNIVQRNKDKAMYVYGCSSCYRRVQGIAVGGYEHPEGANEDGYLALKLRSKFGNLVKISSNSALVWTSDRQLVNQGGLFQAFKKRIKYLFQ